MEKVIEKLSNCIFSLENRIKILEYKKNTTHNESEIRYLECMIMGLYLEKLGKSKIKDQLLNPNHYHSLGSQDSSFTDSSEPIYPPHPFLFGTRQREYNEGRILQNETSSSSDDYY